MSDNYSDLNNLLNIARDLSLTDLTVSRWFKALAKSSCYNLARFCSQLPPANWIDAPSRDALDWADGNPNGFGYQRALDALRHWGEAWPGDHPISAQRFYAELLLGQACALFFGVNPLPIGMAPAIARDGSIYVLRYAVADGQTSWAAYDRDAGAFRTDWDYGRHGHDPIRASTTGLPSLASAQLALNIMLGGSGQGAGWVAGASR